MAWWEALAAGRSDDARRRYEAARAIAEARGFRYVPISDLASGPLESILERLESIAEMRRHGEPAPEVIDALTGGVPVPEVTMTAALADFYSLTADRLIGKNEKQRHR